MLNRTSLWLTLSASIGLWGATVGMTPTAIASSVAEDSQQVASISFGESSSPSSASDSDSHSNGDSNAADLESGDRPTPSSQSEYSTYRQVIQQTTGMVYDEAAQQLVDQYGLDILNVTWEDTGRYDNSAVGPNISDMTIQVQQQNPDTGDYALHLMPVIRYPNFTDQTADVPIDEFFVPVGNAQGEDLRSVSLGEVLGNLRQYLSEPESWAGRETSLLADRDTHVLVSAQACFLPVPQAGMAEFNPVLFNYQSYPGDPAVLTLLVTREGTSVTVIDNQRDAFDAGQTWGQRLFFNQNGDRASLTGQRVSDFLAGENSGREETPDEGLSDDGDRVAGEGLNMVLLIQVPLRQKNPMSFGMAEDSVMMAPTAELSTQRSNVEEAVIGHGEVEGPFTEIDGLEIERDPNFPIRATVQFYKATSNGVISEQDVQAIRQQIARVYSEADYVGSLVVDGATGRPTEYEGDHEEPENWWGEFWRLYNDGMGRSREEAIELWRTLTRDSDSQ